MKKISIVDSETKDICFQTLNNKRFRLRAAAIIIENNKILFATNNSEKYYYSIGGAVELFENTEDAVKREVFEETGIYYEIDRLAFIHENFFTRDDGMFKGIYVHEITFYFLMKSRGSQQLNSHSITQGIEEKMCWLPVDKLDEYDAYPRFFREKLQNMKSYPEHIITIQK